MKLPHGYILSPRILLGVIAWCYLTPPEGEEILFLVLGDHIIGILLFFLLVGFFALIATTALDTE